jgi:hypothetical protein
MGNPIGGMFLSTLVTLIIVPVFYIEFDRFGSFVLRLTRRGAKQEPEPRHEEPVLVVPIPEAAVSVNGESKKPELAPALPLEPRPAT